jgi:hypothetical protein
MALIRKVVFSLMQALFAPNRCKMQPLRLLGNSEMSLPTAGEIKRRAGAPLPDMSSQDEVDARYSGG